MPIDITSLKHYGLITFATTSHALKAEKVLQKTQFKFIIIPTLREISASCGLSIKFRLEDQDLLYETLNRERVPVEGSYQVEKRNGRNYVQDLN